MALRHSESIALAPERMPWLRDHFIATRKQFYLLLGPVLGCILWMLPLGLEPVQQKTLAIVLFMIIYWIAEPIDHGLTALIGIYLFWAFHVVKFSIAFSGFVNSTTWFLFSSLLMAEAAARTGLAKRIGFLLMSKVGSSPTQLLYGLLTLSVILTFFVPSGMGRIAIIAPLTAGILPTSGLNDRGSVGRGFFALLTAFAGFSDVMILSGATTMMTHAILQEHAGIEVLWSQWLVAFLPLSIAMIFVSVTITKWLYLGEKYVLSTGKPHSSKRSLNSVLGPWRRRNPCSGLP